ncbi:hypothetical protein [Aureivirga marina]|uniref:hypothetical protein n=1 Tax=Aureivirga marina TaxID=1182451 RepID=UPI0018CAE78E|nr:hypothetical protein [Aureivirga marina]
MSNQTITNAITIEKAKEWIQNWRRGTCKFQLNSIISISHDRVNFEQVLSEPGVKRVKSYLGVNDCGEMVLLIVGADENDRDLIALDSSRHHVYDMSSQEPPLNLSNDCSPLN